MSLFSYPFISDTPAWPTQSTFHNENASHEFFKGTGDKLFYGADWQIRTAIRGLQDHCTNHYTKSAL